MYRGTDWSETVPGQYHWRRVIFMGWGCPVDQLTRHKLGQFSFFITSLMSSPFSNVKFLLCAILCQLVHSYDFTLTFEMVTALIIKWNHEIGTIFIFHFRCNVVTNATDLFHYSHFSGHALWLAHSTCKVTFWRKNSRTYGNYGNITADLRRSNGNYGKKTEIGQLLPFITCIMSSPSTMIYFIIVTFLGTHCTFYTHFECVHFEIELSKGWRH